MSASIGSAKIRYSAGPDPNSDERAKPTFNFVNLLLTLASQVKRWTAKRLSIQQRKARVAQKKAAFIAAHAAAAELAGSDAGDAEEMDE